MKKRVSQLTPGAAYGFMALIFAVSALLGSPFQVQSVPFEGSFATWPLALLVGADRKSEGGISLVPVAVAVGVVGLLTAVMARRRGLAAVLGISSGYVGGYLGVAVGYLLTFVYIGIALVPILYLAAGWPLARLVLPKCSGLAHVALLGLLGLVFGGVIMGVLWSSVGIFQAIHGVDGDMWRFQFVWLAWFGIGTSSTAAVVVMFNQNTKPAVESQ